MKIMVGALLLVLSTVPSLWAPAYAQGGSDVASSARFEHLTNKQGLSSNRVFSLVQDSRGFIWIGTTDGLNRYDSHTFKVYKHKAEDPGSLSDNVIRTMHEDRDGDLWIGTYTSGLDRYDRETETFTHYDHDPTDPHSLGSNVVRSILEDRQGNLWIATEGGGLNRFDDGQFEHYQHDPTDPRSLISNDVYALLEDKDGTIWVGTADGLNSFDPETGAFVLYQQDPNDPHSLSHNQIESLFEDRGGALWIGTYGGGLNKLDRASASEAGEGRFTLYQNEPNDPKSLSDNIVLAIYEDRAGVLWIGTRAGGLDRFDRETESFASYQHDPEDPRSLSHDQVYTILQDEAGALWLGTFGGGVNRIDPQKQRFRLYPPNPADLEGSSSARVQAVYQDRDGVLWVGAADGLYSHDPGTGQFAHYQHDPTDPDSLSNDNVVAIAEDKADVLWIGTHGGLNKLDPEDGTFTSYQNDPADPHSLSFDRVQTIYADRAGALWIGTFGGGLNKLVQSEAEGSDLATAEEQTAPFICFLHDPDDPSSLSHNAVSAIYEDRTGVIWVGTLAGGLNRLERDSASGEEASQFTRYQHDPDDPHSLSSNSVVAIHEDQAGILWVATFGGLNRFDRASEQFSHYTTADGLPTEVILSILEEDALDRDGAVLWLGTGHGLSRLNTYTEVFKNYDESDGLQGNEFVMRLSFKNSQGEMFFGGLSGFTAFHPADIQDNPYLPSVVVTDFQLENKPVEIGGDSVLRESIVGAKDLVLSHEDRVISFEFAALNYSSPEKNRYRYKLEGFDGEWTEVGSDRPFVTYTNLDPGEYTFHVTGSNNDGVWNEEGTSIGITITPPWWQTWWFRGGAFLLLVGLLVGGFVWQRQSARRRERQLEAMVAERTYELDERVKELDCLYGISSLAGQDGISLEEILRGALELLPPAFRYPEVACARLALDGQEFRSENYQETSWQKRTTILVRGEPAGQVEVNYLEARPEADEGPFLEEEQLLLAAVAERLGRIAERKQAEAALEEALGAADRARRLESARRQEAEQRRQIAEVLGEVVAALNSEEPLEGVLDLIASRARQLLGADAVAVLELESESGAMELLAAHGLPTEHLTGALLGLTLDAVRQAAALGRPMAVPDVPAALFQDDQPIFVSGTDGYQVMMAVPIVAEAKVYGGLVLYYTRPRLLSTEEMELADLLGNHAALAVESARLREEAEQVAVVAERTRIAGELHDSVTQTLYTTSLIAETLPAVWQSHPEEALRSLDELRDLTRGALAEMRTLLLELRPSALAGRKLSELLHQLTAAMSARTDQPITTTVTGDRLLPEEVKIALYRIAQEALNNIDKHAQASQAWIHLRYTSDGTTLRVRDNGRGFDPEVVPPRRLGLKIMRERAQAIGAVLTIESQPGQGTEVAAVWSGSGGTDDGRRTVDDG